MNPKIKERRVVNIEKSAFDKIKKYCDDYAYDMPKWMTMVTLKEFEEKTYNPRLDKEIGWYISTQYNPLDIIGIYVGEFGLKYIKKDSLWEPKNTQIERADGTLVGYLVLTPINKNFNPLPCKRVEIVFDKNIKTELVLYKSTPTHIKIKE